MQEMGNHVTGCITECILHSKTWRNPLPQNFSQCLLKCFPKRFLISPLAWSPLFPVIWVVCVCWYFSHREGRIREGKEEVTTLVSIFNEFMNFIDYPKSRISNETGIFFTHPLVLKLVSVELLLCCGDAQVHLMRSGEFYMSELLGFSLS